MAKFLADVASNVVANLASSIILLVFGFLISRWFDFTVNTRAFRRIFGKRAGRSGDLMIVLDTIRDTRLLPVAGQQPQGASQGHRFFKTFPDKHITTIPGPTEALVPECSARGASYLIDTLRGIRRISVKVVSDTLASPQWNGTFISLGSSYSNIKTDDIKLLPKNPWLQNDAGVFTFKDQSTLQMEQRYDKALIMKIENPHVAGHSLIICEGLGEWGTSSAAWYLSTHWKQLSKRFGRRPFLVALRVTKGTDESAREIKAFGTETRGWRVKRLLHLVPNS